MGIPERYFSLRVIAYLERIFLFSSSGSGPQSTVTKWVINAHYILAELIRAYAQLKSCII